MKELYFKFEDGTIKKMTESGANRFAKDAQRRIIDCNEDGNFKDNKRIRDGFQPGWQHALGMYVTCPGQYKRILKDRGLIEIGNERPVSHEENVRQIESRENREFWSDANIRKMANDVNGLDLSDGDVRRLREEA